MRFVRMLPLKAPTPGSNNELVPPENTWGKEEDDEESEPDLVDGLRLPCRVLQ